jgi:hypothetical protein
MLIVVISGIIGLASVFKSEAFPAIFCAYVLVVGFFGYFLIGGATPCKNLTKQCEIITSMYNDYAGTVIFKDVNNKDANIVDNTVKGVELIKNKKFKVIANYNENHYGVILNENLKYNIVENIEEKIEKAEK